jgi:hypothetical protein
VRGGCGPKGDSTEQDERGQPPEANQNREGWQILQRQMLPWWQ